MTSINQFIQSFEGILINSIIVSVIQFLPKFMNEDGLRLLILQLQGERFKLGMEVGKGLIRSLLQGIVLREGPSNLILLNEMSVKNFEAIVW